MKQNERKYNSNAAEELNVQYGKVPPQAIDVEEIVLSAMILERDCFVNNPLKKEWFYKNEHRLIVECLSQLTNESTPIDLIQVTNKLRSNGTLDVVGGPLAITKLAGKVASAANIEHHIRIIQQEFARRELIRISAETAKLAYDKSADIDDIFSFIQDEFSNVMSYDTEDSSSTYEDATFELIDDLKSGIEPGIKTGITKFDKFTGGFQDSDLIIIAGETSQGKTSLAVSALRHIFKSGTPAAVFSTEMTKKQLVARTTAQETGVGAKNILYNRLTDDHREYVITEMLKSKDFPVYFDDQSNNDIDKICTSLRKLKIKRNIGIALVDFIQDLKGADTEKGVGEIGRKLKNIAKELNIPIIAISQLARDRNSPKPAMSRLRGSGQLEEKADVIMLLWRPEYYGMSFPEPFTDYSTKGTAQVIIGKGRNVGLATFMLNFNKETTNFFDFGPKMQAEYQMLANEGFEAENDDDQPF